jgi:hypothetical protein
MDNLHNQNNDIVKDVMKIHNYLQIIEAKLDFNNKLPDPEEISSNTVNHTNKTLGYLIPLSLGHNGSLDQKEQSELIYHLKAAQFI